MLPGERESGVAGKLPEEGPLRPPVTLAERMQCVDLAQVIGQPPNEHVMMQAPQAVLIVQLTEDNGRRGLYVLRQAEHGALGDGYRPDLPCPLVDVAENPPVDLPQVGQVITGRGGRFIQQYQRRMSDLPFRRFKRGGRSELEPVVQDPGDRITVRVL